ncbi:hypothetical protein KPL26_12575 [Clostridium algidicarnis]|uniref:hypothetical protein n=1 Tax=Clostridium algidicarnis TaxID=37659 RepID=UPI001C0C157F|nr:hypothetical protein [Clostridium algidicarnis]MBU3197494.1 hypothetical protein [Clostridium algidicarnis]
MSLILGAAMWMLAGAVITGVIAAFWEEIRGWLDSVAADFVEKHLGYGAREKMHRAVSTINKLKNKINNTSVVYTKRNNLDSYFDKTTIVSEAPIYEIDNDIIEEINKKGHIIQEFEYRQ